MQPNFDAMPAELQAVPRWVLWKDAKVPYNALAVNSKASSTNPDTWASFGQVQTAYHEGGYSGVGFVLNGDGIVGIDLDDCVEDGEPEPLAMGLMDRVGCKYIEISPSGTGLRGFGYGINIKGRRGLMDGINTELYADARYLTVTGHAIRSGPLVQLPGFSDVAASMEASPYRREQKNTEDDRSHLLSSSILFCPSSVLFCRGACPHVAAARGAAQQVPV